MKLKLFPSLVFPRFTALVFLCLAVLATVILVAQSLLPTGPSQNITHFDKVMHFGSYLILTVLWGLALRLKPMAAIVLAMIILGIGLEIAQQVMDLGRTGSLWDAVANGAGAVLAAGVLRVLFEPADNQTGRSRA